MPDRNHVPWLPRIGGFKTTMLEIGVRSEHVPPVVGLWLVATGDEQSAEALQSRCAADLRETVGYREVEGEWRWQAEADNGRLDEVKAPSPDELFTSQGVVEGWLFGVHPNAARFSDAASAIYQGLIGGNVSAIVRPLSPAATPFRASTELTPSFFADFPRLDWTRAQIFAPRGLPERHWAYDDFELLCCNLRFRRADLGSLAKKLERRRGKFKSDVSPAVEEQRKRALAVARFEQRMAEVPPPTRTQMQDDINEHLRVAGFFGPMQKSDFKKLWEARASREMRKPGRPSKKGQS